MSSITSITTEYTAQQRRPSVLPLSSIQRYDQYRNTTNNNNIKQSISITSPLTGDSSNSTCSNISDHTYNIDTTSTSSNDSPQPLYRSIQYNNNSENRSSPTQLPRTVSNTSLAGYLSHQHSRTNSAVNSRDNSPVRPIHNLPRRRMHDDTIYTTNSCTQNHISSSIQSTKRTIHNDLLNVTPSGKGHSHDRITLTSIKQYLHKQYILHTYITCLILGSAVLCIVLYIYGVIQYKLTQPHKFNSFTIFSLLRDMTPDTYEDDRVNFAIQWNSLQSWYNIVDAQNIIVFVDTEESCQWLVTQFIGIQCLTVSCWHEQYHKPMLNCVFNDAHQHSPTDIMLMANGDIILTPAIGHAIQHVHDHVSTPYYAMVAQRLDLVMPQRLIDNFMSSDNIEQIMDLTNIAALQHGDYGIDIFCYHRSLIESMNFPSFLAGVYRWDNWLLSEFILRTDITVVDATRSVQVIHQQLGQEGSGEHGKRKGASYNDNLVKGRSGTHYKLGHMDNSDMKLMGDCSDTCTMTINQNAAYDVLYTRHARNDDQTVTLVYVTTYNYRLFMNWYCWTQRINYTNYIVLAGDIDTNNKLNQVNVPHITKHNGVQTYDTIDNLVDQIEQNQWITAMLLNTLNAGFSLIYSDVSNILFSDMHHSIDSSTDIYTLNNSTSTAGISTTLMYIRASTYGRHTLKLVQNCLTQQFNDINQHPAKLNLTVDDVRSRYTLESCVVDVVTQLQKNKKFKYQSFDVNQYLTGHLFFDRRYNTLTGNVPVVITTQYNSMESSTDIYNRIQANNLLSYNTTTQQCITNNELMKLDEYVANKPNTNQFQLTIRILTQTRDQSLKRCLDSLNNAIYNGDTVNLEVSVDYPASDADADEIKQRSITLAMCKKYRWNHGKYTVIDQVTNLGLVGQWTRGWYPPHTSTLQYNQPVPIIMFLEDDTTAMPHYYTWLKSAVNKYYLDEYDPQLYGISLQSQHTILGESITQRYGKHTTADLLSNSTYIFKYQLLGTWGAVFFPDHWLQFLHWYNNIVHGDYHTGTSQIMQPCVVNSLSNKWWAANPKKTWTQWFIRFAYETGYYSLYTNYPQKESWVVNWREGGLNFLDTRGPMNPGVQHIVDEIHMKLPDTSSIDVYDFAFRSVNQSSELGYRRLHITQDQTQFDHCYTIDQMKKYMAELDKQYGTTPTQLSGKTNKHNINKQYIQHIQQALPA